MSVCDGMHEHDACFSQARSVAEGILAAVALMQDSRLPCFGRGAPIPNLRKRFHLDMTEAKAAAFMRSTILDAYDKVSPLTALLLCHAACHHVPHGFLFCKGSLCRVTFLYDCTGGVCSQCSATHMTGPVVVKASKLDLC